MLSLLLTPLSVTPTTGNALSADNIVDTLIFGQTNGSDVTLIATEVDLPVQLEQCHIVVDLGAVPLWVLDNFGHLKCALSALHFRPVMLSNDHLIHSAVQTPVHTVGSRQNPFVTDHRSTWWLEAEWHVSSLWLIVPVILLTTGVIPSDRIAVVLERHLPRELQGLSVDSADDVCAVDRVLRG